MSFENLEIIEPILKALKNKGYTEPTEIQKQAIPLILNKSDLIAISQTGSGKTAAFTIPLLQRTFQGLKKPLVRALILTPTRELALQVQENVALYGKYLPLKSAAIFGGVSIFAQIQGLRKGVDIIVATPGRLLDHLTQKTIDLSKIEILVLDEADRMLDMGFIPDIKKIIKTLPKNRQSLLFSATISNEVKKLSYEFLQSPKIIEIASQNKTAKNILQTVYLVDSQRKTDLLINLIRTQNWNQALVFTRTKRGADRLAEQLIEINIKAATIHSNKSQFARTKALSHFKKGNTQILVATDIAARGLDIHQLPHVVNFEMPNVPEDYVHRIGRTGRADHVGEAISFVSGREKRFLHDIEKHTKQTLNKVTVKGFEPSTSEFSSDKKYKNKTLSNSNPRISNNSYQRPNYKKAANSNNTNTDQQTFYKKKRFHNRKRKINAN